MDISKLLKRAEDASTRRNYELSIFNYIQALSLQPDHIEARRCLRAIQTRQYNETGGSAIRRLFLHIRAQILVLFGKHEQALITCENALSANPTHLSTLDLLARCATAMKLLEVAAWQRQEICDRHGSKGIANLRQLSELYMELGRGEDAIRCLERIQLLDAHADVGSAIVAAEAKKMSTTYQKAVTDGSRAVLQNQQQTEQLDLDSSKLRTDEARRKAAQYLLEHDVKERPNDHRLYLRLGDIFFELEDWNEGYSRAKEFYHKAQQINATDSTMQDRLGDLEIKALRIECRRLQEQSRDKPEDKAIKARVRDANHKLFQYELAEYERRVRIQPLKAAFHNRLGELYFQIGRHEEAIAELQQASKDPKFKISGLTLLGRCFHATGQLEMAIAQFQKAREGQELFEKIKDALYYEALSWEARADSESLGKALELYTRIYETDISYRDVRAKVPSLQSKRKEGI